jgi:hypothetical protein
MNITAQSAALFTAYANDADNWNGTPLVGGNVLLVSAAADRGNLTDLKKAGLISTFVEEGCSWVKFTPLGVEYAASLGIAL